MLKLKRNVFMIFAIAGILTNMISVVAIENDNVVTSNNKLCCNESFTPPTKEEILESDAKVKDMVELVKLLGLNHRESNDNLNTEKDINSLDSLNIKSIMGKYNNVIRSGYDGPTPPIDYRIPLRAVTQLNHYYCGPASAYMVLKGQGASVTQYSLANDLYTTTAGTGFGQRWADVLNTYSNHTYNVMWGSPYDTTQRAIELTDTSIGSLVSGYGVVYNTIQYKNSSERLSGYPTYLSSDIYHYVAGEGYDVSDPSRRGCYYIDPNNGYSYSYGHHKIGYRLMCTLIKDRGMIA